MGFLEAVAMRGLWDSEREGIFRKREEVGLGEEGVLVLEEEEEERGERVGVVEAVELAMVQEMLR